MSEIITGDCIEVMRGMADGSVGLTLTSPPYNVGLKYDGFGDDLTEDEHREFSAAWLAELFRVTRDTGRMYVAVSDRMLWWFRDVAVATGWTYGQLLVWCKPNFGGGAGRNSGEWNMMSECILLFRKGKRVPMLTGGNVNTHNWFVEATPQSNFNEGRIHPAQMPVILCEKIIARTPGDPVFDPFAGSGSVLVAAKRLGRPHLGVELVEAVANRARKRLSGTGVPLMFEAQPEQGGMFAPNGAK